MLERLSLYNDVLLVASSPLQERITQQEFLFSTSVHSDKNKICIQEKDCRRIKMCAGERLPYFNFLLSNNNRDWSVIFFSLPYRMTSSSPFNCETPNLILKDVNRQEKDFFQKLEHSLFSEIGLNSCFKKIRQFLNCSLPFLYSDVRLARTWRSYRYFAELFRPNNLAN